MSYYDSSVYTKRTQSKTISNSYITRTTQDNKTGYASLLGIWDSSVVNDIKLGQSQEISKRNGNTIVNYGCPCPGATTEILQPIDPCLDSGPSWVASVNTSSSSDRNTEQYSTYYDCSTLYTVGRVINTAYFYDGNNYGTPKITITSPVGKNVGYLSKYTKSGILEWIAPVYGGTSDDNPIISVTGDDTGIYVVGYFSGTLQIFNGSLDPMSSSLFDIITSGNSGAVSSTFIIKYDKNGNVLWVNRIDNNIGVLTGDNYWNIVSDGQYLYLGWQYIIDASVLDCKLYDSSDLLNPALVLVPPAGTNVPLLLKYSTSGKLSWAIHLPGNSETKYGIGAAQNESGVYMIIDMLGGSNSMTIYEANQNIFGDPAQPTATLVTLTKPGDQWGSVALIKYNKQGKLIWATNTSSPAGNGSYTRTISCDDSYVYFGGNGSSDITVYNASPTGPGSSVFTLTGGTGFVISHEVLTGKVLWGTAIQNFSGAYNQVNRLMSDGVSLYVTGRYEGSIQINSGSSQGSTCPKSALITNSGDDDIFIARFDLNGRLLWITKISGSGKDTSYDVFSNKSYVYVAGFGFNTVNFYNSYSIIDPFEIGITYSPVYDNKFAFLVKYSNKLKIL